MIILAVEWIGVLIAQCIVEIRGDAAYRRARHLAMTDRHRF